MPGFESCSLPFLFSFCLSLVLLLLFVKYIPSRAKIVYLWINNLNFYRFLQFSLLFFAIYFTTLKQKPHAVTNCLLLYRPSFDWWSLLSAREACFELYSLSCQSCFHINNYLSLVSVIALYFKWGFEMCTRPHFIKGRWVVLSIVLYFVEGL